MKLLLPTLLMLVCIGVALMPLLPGSYIPTAFSWFNKVQHVLAFCVLSGQGVLAYKARSLQIVVGLLVFSAVVLPASLAMTK